jgi:hypothetical protein
MNLTLRRTAYTIYGVFGQLFDEKENLISFTLEHSFDGRPKIPTGEYKCVRGLHRLEHMSSDFMTFEVTNVPDHTGILFHVGNTQADSTGCILLGMEIMDVYLDKSRIAFEKFLELECDVDEFQLTVK